MRNGKDTLLCIYIIQVDILRTMASSYNTANKVFTLVQFREGGDMGFLLD